MDLEDVMSSEMSYMQNLKVKLLETENNKIASQVRTFFYHYLFNKLPPLSPHLLLLWPITQGARGRGHPSSGGHDELEAQPRGSSVHSMQTVSLQKNWGWALVCPVLALGKQGRNTPLFAKVLSESSWMQDPPAIRTRWFGIKLLL